MFGTGAGCVRREHRRGAASESADCLRLLIEVVRLRLVDGSSRALRDSSTVCHELSVTAGLGRGRAYWLLQVNHHERPEESSDSRELLLGSCFSRSSTGSDRLHEQDPILAP